MKEYWGESALGSMATTIFRKDQCWQLYIIDFSLKGNLSFLLVLSFPTGKRHSAKGRKIIWLSRLLMIVVDIQKKFVSYDCED